ncbi:MAG: ABC transporter ATP-binding protein [Halobacteriaceae archaeon]
MARTDSGDASTAQTESVTSEETPATDDPVVSVRDASVTFDMERGISRVLDDASIDVERGEVLGIVGESGSGKSMFASAMLDAVVQPGQLSGEVTFRPSDGEAVDVLDLDSEALRRLRWEDVSMVFQGAMSSFNPTMTVGDHFRETLTVHDYDVEAGMQRAADLLTDLYLDPDRVLDSYPHELSGGMQQRALIALSLVLEPEVLVMDEPTAALDLLMQRSIISLLDDLRDEYDLTMVFITHDLELVASISDRLAVMYAFEFVEVGDATDIVRDAAHPYTRALINSTPNLQMPIEEMHPIEGSSPDPVNIPSGCSYHPRCPLADDFCRENDPGYVDGPGEGHVSACFYADRVDDAVPLSVGHEATWEEEPAAATAREEEGTVVSLDDVEVHFEEGSGLNPFSDPDVVRAVDGVDLDVYENDVVALVGESGCGKTTLGKTVIGVQEPTAGSVTYRGQDVWEARGFGSDADVPFEEIRRSLQIIHQDPGSSLNPNKTVLWSLSRPLKLWSSDLSVEDRRARVFGMLEHVGMTPPEDYANRYPHQLSGGEKQRVALVRALLMNPDLILADEAVSALDVSLRVEMMDLMLDLQDQFDTSFLFISHNLSNARYLVEHADGRIGIMYLGELVEVGTAREVLRDPKHPYTQVLMWATPDIDPEADEVAEPPVRQIDIPDPTDPPSGCRFHTRCPEAREVCAEETPALFEAEDAETQQVACFRSVEDHEYWDSDPLPEEPPGTDGEGGIETGAADGD